MTRKYLRTTTHLREVYMSVPTLLKLYDMEPPRYVGSPNQFFINNYIELQKFYDSHNGRRALYIAHNYHTITEVTMTKMLFDFDLEDKRKKLVFGLKEVMSDALKVCEHFSDYSWKLSYTGGGIQTFMKIEPIIGNPDEIDVHGFQSVLKDKLNLSTLDLASATPTKLARALLSRHIKQHTINGVKQWVRDNRYCVPITINDLTGTPEDLYELSEMKNQTHIQLGGIPFEFTNTIDRKTLDTTKKTQMEIDWWSLPEDKFLEMAQVIFDDEYQGLMNPMPSATLRVKGAIKVKEFGMEKESAVKFFDRFEQIAGWENRNTSIIRKNIYYIWNRGYKLR